MKKFYSAPVVEIEKFEVADIITASAFLGKTDAAYAGLTGDSKYTEVVGIEW